MRRKSWLRPPAANTLWRQQPLPAGNEGRHQPGDHEPAGPYVAHFTRSRPRPLAPPAGWHEPSSLRRPGQRLYDHLAPQTVLPKIRHVLEYLPGSVFFWDGDGAMTHEDQMRSLRLMGEEVIPAVREMGKELELFSPFEDPATGKPLTTAAGAPCSLGQRYDLIAACLFPLPAERVLSQGEGLFPGLDVPHLQTSQEDRRMPSMLTAVTVSDLLHQLGETPPERVRLQLPPGHSH